MCHYFEVFNDNVGYNVPQDWALGPLWFFNNFLSNSSFFRGQVGFQRAVNTSNNCDLTNIDFIEIPVLL